MPALRLSTTSPKASGSGVLPNEPLVVLSVLKVALAMGEQVAGEGMPQEVR
jgi:hypothetical protein